MNIVEHAKQKWNKEADEYNQWDALSEDEKINLIIEQELKMYDAVIDDGFNIDIAIEDKGLCTRQNCNNCKMGKFIFDNNMKDKIDDLCKHEIVYILAKAIKTFTLNKEE